MVNYQGQANLLMKESLFDSRFWQFQGMVPASTWLWGGPFLAVSHIGGWQHQEQVWEQVTHVEQESRELGKDQACSFHKDPFLQVL